MPIIAVVDDRKTERKQLVRGITLSEGVPDGWEVEGFNPLNNLDDYFDWIGEEDVAVLVLDERLREEREDVEVHVDYDGHDVVDKIRTKHPTFPIFVVTAVPDDQNVSDRFSSVEAIIDRADFVKDSDKLVPRIVRSGQRFFDTNEDRLSEMESLSRLVAQDEASEEDLKRLEALRQHFQLPYEDQIQTPDSWIAEFERAQGDLKSLEAEMSEMLKNSEDNHQK